MHIGQIIVGRWLCPHCLTTFRHLPPFIEQHKRYMTCTIEEVAASVLTKRRKPYRTVVKRPPPNRISYIYERGDGSSMSHSSCWHWIAWMAAITLMVLAQQPEAATASSRENFERDGHVFSPEQAKTAERFEALYLARRLHLSGRLKVPIDHRHCNAVF